MQDFTDLSYTSSPEHKDSTERRIKRYASDLDKIRMKLASCSLFTSDPTLRNVINWIVAGPKMSVHDFEWVGHKITAEDMIGKSALISLRKLNFPEKKEDFLSWDKNKAQQNIEN